MTFKYLFWVEMSVAVLAESFSCFSKELREDSSPETFR